MMMILWYDTMIYYYYISKKFVFKYQIFSHILINFYQIQECQDICNSTIINSEIQNDNVNQSEYDVHSAIIENVNYFKNILYKTYILYNFQT